MGPAPPMSPLRPSAHLRERGSPGAGGLSAPLLVAGQGPVPCARGGTCQDLVCSPAFSLKGLVFPARRLRLGLGLMASVYREPTGGPSHPTPRPPTRCCPQP